MFKCIETSSLLKCSDNDDIDSNADIQKNKNKIQGIPNQRVIIKTSATVHISGANICILYQIYNNKNQLIVYLLKKNSISFFVIQGFIILFKYYFVDINSGYEKEYRRTAGDDSRYFYASSYVNLSAIETDVIAAITKCPVTQPVTTTDGSLMFADVCKYILCVTVSLLV